MLFIFCYHHYHQPIAVHCLTKASLSLIARHLVLSSSYTHPPPASHLTQIINRQLNNCLAVI